MGTLAVVHTSNARIDNTINMLKESLPNTRVESWEKYGRDGSVDAREKAQQAGDLVVVCDPNQTASLNWRDSADFDYVITPEGGLRTRKPEMPLPYSSTLPQESSS